MLAGIYYGAMYGGSTTSILVNMPGEAASVITCLDGHQMAKKGRAGAALGIAAFGSFIAGTIGAVGIMLVAPPMAKFALAFGPAEYFSLLLMGIVISYLELAFDPDGMRSKYGEIIQGGQMVLGQGPGWGVSPEL
jgi:putative tricarboxylic transport membrane protein